MKTDYLVPEAVEIIDEVAHVPLSRILKECTKSLANILGASRFPEMNFASEMTTAENGLSSLYVH